MITSLTAFGLALGLCFVCSSIELVGAAQCKEVEFTSDKCRSSNDIRIAGQTIHKSSQDVRIKLPGSQNDATWFCGSSRERVAWGEAANQIRVNFLNDGTIQWTVYNCDDLSGPVRAGIKCADEAFSTACPGKINDTCVFEVSSSTSFIDKTTTTVQVTGELAHQISTSTSATISGSVTQERSQITERKYGQKSYLVIPGGFKFCSYSDAESIADTLAPTGYKWQCSLTKFVQAKLSYSGPCSDLPKCDKHVCVARGGNSGATKSQFSAILAMVVVQAVTFTFQL